MMATQEIQMKDYFSNKFKSLLEGLLSISVKSRFCLTRAKQHPFFASIDWDKLIQKQIKPPIKPKVVEGDIKNFKKEVTRMNMLEESSVGTEYQQSMTQSNNPFAKFTYNEEKLPMMSSGYLRSSNGSREVSPGLPPDLRTESNMDLSFKRETIEMIIEDHHEEASLK